MSPGDGFKRGERDRMGGGVGQWPLVGDYGIDEHRWRRGRRTSCMDAAAVKAAREDKSVVVDSPDLLEPYVPACQSIFVFPLPFRLQRHQTEGKTALREIENIRLAAHARRIETKDRMSWAQ